MKNLHVKFSNVSNEVEEVSITSVPATPAPVKTRIDEEGLFGLFTANIIKLKKQFIR